MLRIINEDKEIRIDDKKFKSLLNSDLKKIIIAIENEGFEVRIVGGAVRDLLLGLEPRDIDLSTTASPDEVIYILSDLDIEADVWGIAHGTVKAVIKNVKYEITSLNFQIHKKDGKLIVKSHGTWEDDAERRDFTVNAMSMTLNGVIHDYMGGLEDLEKQVIRPLPHFEDKIHDDPVLIMRFFKMLAKFSKPAFSKETLDIIERSVPLLSQLEPKRIRKELLNIRKSPNAKEAQRLMKKFGATDVLNSVLKSHKQK
jgi:poly(A) polymerase